MIIWNPWHGCHRVSEGCDHCYMYFLDAKRGIDTSRVFRTRNFAMPLARGRNGDFKVAPGMELLVGLSTDFFVEEADAWRPEAWDIIRRRPDVVFRLLTKRASRIAACLPPDWGGGYENVMLQVTCENQRRAGERLPVLLDLPARHRGFMAAPLLGPIDATPWLATGLVEQVLCGGENYGGARPCRHEWVQALSDQCRAHSVQFDFIETGTLYVKDGKTYRIPDKRMQSRQAFRSGLGVPGRPVRYELRHAEGSLFGGPVARRTGPFLPSCADCGSRMTCNGCSHCGACGAHRPPPPECTD
jgi:protein gp37